MMISAPAQQVENRYASSSSTVQQFSDPHEYQASVRGADLRLFLTAPGQYRARLTKIAMPRLWMQRGETSLPHVAHSVWSKGRSIILIHTGAQQAPMQHNGQEQSVGQILFGALGSEFHRRSQEGQWGSMSLTPDDLAAVGEVVVGREVTVPSVARIIQPPPQLMSHLLRLHAAAGHLAETVPDILAHPEIARAMEHALVQAMVECVSTGLIDEPKVRSHTRVPVMRRFEQILAAHEGETLYLAEVCAKIGVSDRTLRGHCQEHLGMSPHKYLWLRRMNLARRALALADPAGASVTAIATDHGFWELGQFAVSYRRLFGESPSVTLRRVPELQLPAHGRSPFDLNLSSG